MKLSTVTIALSLASTAVAAYKPVVLWHGMGDDCCNPQSMGHVVDLLEAALPGVFVHSIQVGKTINEDHEAGFFGVINNQVDYVCEQLAAIPELAGGFNAIGFSQGGLFMRAYVERCNQPPVNRLITFGSPHSGEFDDVTVFRYVSLISHEKLRAIEQDGYQDIPNCINRGDLTCALMRSLVRRGAYSNYIQHRVVQAQYYRDPKNLQAYKKNNIFLPAVNNEGESKNATYKENLSGLDMFVLVRFADDLMVKPPETAWFWTFDEDENLVPLDQQDLYQQDWLGLQALEERDALRFVVSPGQHMEITDDFFNREIIPYLAEGGKPRFVNQH